MAENAAASLSKRILKTEDILWRELEFIQQETLKELSPEDDLRLEYSILTNGFINPFFIWEDPETGKRYSIDGKHRHGKISQIAASDPATLAARHKVSVEKVQSDWWWEIPDMLPATFIRCANIQDAANLVLIFSAWYAKITQQGLFDFVGMYDLDYDKIKAQVAFPEFSVDRFEQKFDIFGTQNLEDEQVLVEEEATVIVQPGDLFEINGHRIICGSFREEETVAALMDGKKARIINCDPPYNLPANFFTNKDHSRHKDFAMAAGEMSDAEFVQFLMLIMQRSVDNSVPGSIHYIFMDFRHIWHMTEAGRQVYGPKGFKQMCVWTKDNFANGSFYRAQHELCFVFNNLEAKYQWNNDIADEGGFYKNDNALVFIFKNGDGAKHLSHLELKDRIRTNVWKYPSATSVGNPDRKEIYNHPTPKPVAMIADSILDTTNEGDIVVDWFLGSGTCLIGCAQTKRFCYATEIEPHYVQGDILRYLKWAERNNVTVDFRHVNGSLTLADFEVLLPVSEEV